MCVNVEWKTNVKSWLRQATRDAFREREIVMGVAVHSFY